MEDMLPPDHSLRMQRTLLALEGLSLGDAFGECFFDGSVVLAALGATRALPAAPWNYTDDTEMALAIVEVLTDHGRIEQEQLAQVFARRYRREPRRGYAITIDEANSRLHALDPDGKSRWVQDAALVIDVEHSVLTPLWPPGLLEWRQREPRRTSQPGYRKPADVW